jgi:hypothetical protein
MKLNFPIEQEEAGTDIRLMENFFKKASEDLGSTRDENISKSVSLEEEWSES